MLFSIPLLFCHPCSSGHPPLHRQLHPDRWLHFRSAGLLHLRAVHHHWQVGQGQETLPPLHRHSHHPCAISLWHGGLLQPPGPQLLPTL